MIRGILGSGFASKIAPGLWQGGYPRWLSELPSKGIDVLVLAAREFQPDYQRAPDGLELIHVPMYDETGGPTEDEAERAEEAAADVAYALNEGKTVLTTCAMGINRSGLINAIVLMDRYGLSAPEAVRQIRTARPGALSNQSFVQWLASR